MPSPYERQFPGLFRKPAAHQPEMHIFSPLDVCQHCGVNRALVLDNLALPQCDGIRPVDTAEVNRIWRAVRATAEGTNAPVDGGVELSYKPR